MEEEIKEKNPFEEFAKVLTEDIKRVGKVVEDGIVLEGVGGSVKIGVCEKPPELIDVYRDIFKTLNYYLDLNPRYYNLITLWIIGTYFHDLFPSYPYLFFNAMRGSGKSRTMRLITTLSKDGSMLNSLTEAVLFRTKGTLGIDEFEGLARKGNESLRELLNSAYKKGIKVKRMKKIKTLTGEEQVVENFDVYRPILICNINGMDDVLGDRCIQIILDKSNNPKITKIIENFENTTTFKEILNSFVKGSHNHLNDVVDVDVVVSGSLYKCWNNYVKHNDTNDINNTNNTNDINDIQLKLFKKIDKTGIEGRALELSFPLFIIAGWLGEEFLDETLDVMKELMDEKKKEDSIENMDISLIEFISQETDNGWLSLKQILQNFKEYLQMNDEWLNERWFGKALKRLNLIKDKKRMTHGRMIILNIQKAQEKIRMFK